MDRFRALRRFFGTSSDKGPPVEEGPTVEEEPTGEGDNKADPVVETVQGRDDAGSFSDEGTIGRLLEVEPDSSVGPGLFDQLSVQMASYEAICDHNEDLG